jgi:sensor domain CHASE-containing protein
MDYKYLVNKPAKTEKIDIAELICIIACMPLAYIFIVIMFCL